MKVNFGHISWKDILKLRNEANKVRMSSELREMYTVMLSAYEAAVHAEWSKAQALGTEIHPDEVVSLNIEFSFEPYAVQTGETVTQIGLLGW
jgi:hypothetical protein